MAYIPREDNKGTQSRKETKMFSFAIDLIKGILIELIIKWIKKLIAWIRRR